MVAGPLARGLIALRKVEGLSFVRSFRIVHHRDKRITLLAQEFMDLCKNYETDFSLPLYNGLY